MGQIWSLWDTFSNVIKGKQHHHNIYVELPYDNGVCYAIPWPETWADFQYALQQLFQARYETLDFEDASYEKSQKYMRVCSETTFQALVPKQLSLYNDMVQVFYVGIKLPTRNHVRPSRSEHTRHNQSSSTPHPSTLRGSQCSTPA
jgi:hypothetical protein